MKIIASVNEYEFIAQLSKQEIDFLAGKRIGYDEGYYGHRKINAGTTFDIIKAFGQIHRNDQRRNDVETVRKTLEGVLNSLDIIDRFIEEPKTEEEKASE